MPHSERRTNFSRCFVSSSVGSSHGCELRPNCPNPHREFCSVQGVWGPSYRGLHYFDTHTSYYKSGILVLSNIIQTDVDLFVADVENSSQNIQLKKYPPSSHNRRGSLWNQPWTHIRKRRRSSKI